MPSPQGPRNALDTITTAGSGSIDWVISGLFPRPDATCALTGGAISYQLLISNWNFAIPSGATVNGIVVTVIRSTRSGTGSIHDYEVTLGALTDNKADTVTAWPPVADEGGPTGTAFYGTASDTWGVTWPAGTINSSGFTVVMSAKEYSLMSAATAGVRSVSVTVYYAGGVELVPTGGFEACAPSRFMTRTVMLPYNG